MKVDPKNYKTSDEYLMAILSDKSTAQEYMTSDLFYIEVKKHMKEIDTRDAILK